MVAQGMQLQSPVKACCFTVLHLKREHPAGHLWSHAMQRIHNTLQCGRSMHTSAMLLPVRARAEGSGPAASALLWP